MHHTDKLSNLKFYLLSYLSITLISLVFLYPSFYLAFSDDDWYTILLYKTGSRLGLFTPYGVQWRFFGVLYDFIGPTYYVYFIIAFILRSMAAFSILIFTYTFTKNRTLAILGGVMFSVGFSGIQTTYEVVNMNVYMSIIGLIIFLRFFYLTRNSFSIKNLILMEAFLFVTTLISPVRTYPIFAWALIVDVLWLLKNPTNGKLKSTLIRQSLLVFLFLFLSQIGTFQWRMTDNLSLQDSYLTRIGNYLSQNYEALINFDLTLISNLFTGIGSVILPNKDTLPPNFNTFIGVICIIILITASFLFLKRNRKDSFLFLDFLVWVPVFYVGYLIIITIDPALMPLVYSPARYFLPIYTGFVISFVFLAQVIIEKKSPRLKTILFSIAGLLILFHSTNTYTYLRELSKTRDGFYSKEVWTEIKTHVPKLNISSGKPSIFYFETENSNRSLYTITGSGRQYVILYDIPQLPEPHITPYAPMVFYKFEGLIEVLSGKFQGVDAKINPLEQPPWERIYAFRLEGDKLIDIKKDVKVRVEDALKTKDLE